MKVLGTILGFRIKGLGLGVRGKFLPCIGISTRNPHTLAKKSASAKSGIGCLARFESAITLIPTPATP